MQMKEAANGSLFRLRHLEAGSASIRRRALMRTLVESLFGKVVANLGFVVEHLEIGGLEQLRVAIAQGLADDLLHARVVQFALPGSFFGDQLVDGVAGSAASGSGAVVDGKNLCDLSRLELADGVVDFRFGTQLRLEYEAHVAAIRDGVRILGEVHGHGAEVLAVLQLAVQSIDLPLCISVAGGL